MSVQLLCPTCGRVAELHRPPVTDCAYCHSPFPEPLRRSGELALRRHQAPKPLLLTLGQWASLFVGLLMALFIMLAPFDVGTYSIGSAVVPGPEWLWRGGWLFAVVGGLLLGIGVGLWRERAWARPLMLVYWLSMLLVAFTDPDAGISDVVGLLVFSGIALGSAAWYLYLKPNVRAFFETRHKDSSAPRGV